MSGRRPFGMYRARVLRAALLALLASGCTWEPGGPFALVSPQLRAGLVVPDGRDAGMGWQLLADDYELRIDSLMIDGEHILLIDNASGALDFDPSDPPPGYSLCDNGHCHADDGSLVSYEEVAEALAESGGAAVLMALEVGPLDVHAGVERELECEPGCELPLAHIAQAHLHIEGLHASGVVRDRRSPARIEGEQPWSLTLEPGPEEELELIADLDLPADREHPPEVALTVELWLSGALFDGIAWPEMEPPLDMAADPVQRANLLAAFAETPLVIEIDR